MYKGDAVFRQGSQGEFFYAVLSGSVGIYVNEHEIEAEKHPFNTHDGNTPLGHLVRTCAADSTFGELALAMVCHQNPIS